MIWLKKNLLFCITMALLGGVLIVEIVMILGQRGEARKVEAEFLAKVEEYRRLAGQEVLPHERNVNLTAEEIERQREELDLYQDSMEGEDGLAEAFAAHPTTRTNALFDIANFVIEYRKRAIAAGLSPVEIETNHFGFEEYASVGPEESQLGAVYKQRLIVAHILDQLFEAQPQSLIEVRRPGLVEQPDSEGADADNLQGRAPAPARASAASAGNFNLGPQISAAIPGVVETSAYQVVFTGRASTLRTFLNELTSFDMPLIVRSVQVAPGTEASERRREPTARRATRRRQAVAEVEEPASAEETAIEAAQGPERIPIVADNLSRFTVAMEFVDVLHPVDDSGQ